MSILGYIQRNKKYEVLGKEQNSFFGRENSKQKFLFGRIHLNLWFVRHVNFFSGTDWKKLDFLQFINIGSTSYINVNTALVFIYRDFYFSLFSTCFSLSHDMYCFLWTLIPPSPSIEKMGERWWGYVYCNW